MLLLKIVLGVLIVYQILRYWSTRNIPIEASPQHQEVVKPAFDLFADMYGFKYVAETVINQGPFYKPLLCLEYSGDKDTFMKFMSDKESMRKVQLTHKAFMKRLIKEKKFSPMMVSRCFIDENAKPVCIFAILNKSGVHIYEPII